MARWVNFQPLAWVIIQVMPTKRFIEIYNFERPHEALGQEPPACHYAVSSRSWSGELRSPEYPGDYLVRRVRLNGSIKLEGGEVFVTRFLSSEPVGLIERASGWGVYYGPIELGEIRGGQLHSEKLASTKARRRIRKKKRVRKK